MKIEKINGKNILRISRSELINFYKQAQTQTLEAPAEYTSDFSFDEEHVPAEYKACSWCKQYRKPQEFILDQQEKQRVYNLLKQIQNEIVKERAVLEANGMSQEEINDIIYEKRMKLHADAELGFSHGLCPMCHKKVLEEISKIPDVKRTAMQENFKTIKISLNTKPIKYANYIPMSTNTIFI